MKHARAATCIGGASLFVMALCLMGCPGTPEAPIEKWGDIPPPIEREVPPPPRSLDDPAALPLTQNVRCEIVRLELPLELTLQEAWAFVDETQLTDMSRAVWNANGLRVGVLRSADSDAFSKALGEIQGSRKAMHQGGSFPTAIRISRGLNAEFFVDLTRPGGEARMLPVTKGKLQLLAAFEPTGGGALVALTPHHHKPKASLYPRSPLQKALDGRIFNELGVDVSVNPNSLLLVGLFRPPVEPEVDKENADDEEEYKDKEQDAPADEPRVFASWEDPPPLNLGRGLFTTPKDTQFLYVMRVLPQ